MKTLFLSLLSLAFFSADLVAQGFNVFNNRNHPYLNWQVAETEHFEIIYPDRISGIENEASAIAEASYRALSENMGVSFDRKVRIYLADMDEIKNGFANPIGKGYTMIWVNLNDYSARTTGRAKWLRQVIAHELAHIFHFKAVWSGMGLLQYAIGNPTPLFWAEGVAQYQTEEWSSQRGDRWLRKAIFDSRPGFRDGRSIENGSLMYAVGNSQLRYFTEKYGDSTFTEMLAHRNRRLGLFEYHDMYEAFGEAVEGGYDAFYEDWRKHMNIYYNTLASQMERTDSLETDALGLPGSFYFDMAVSPDGRNIALLSLPSLRRPVRNLYIVKNDSTFEARKVAEGAINSDLNWDRDGKTLYYSRRIRGEHSSIVHDIHMLHTETGKEQRVTRSRRAGFPAAGPQENQVSYIVNESGTSNLFTLDRETGLETRVTSNRGDVQMQWPVWIESQRQWLFYRFDESGNRNLVLFDPLTAAEDILDDGSTDNRKPLLSPDEKSVAFTSLRDEVPNVFVYNFASGSSRRVTNLFTGAEAYGWIEKAAGDTLEKAKLLIRASETKRRDRAWWIEADRIPFGEEIYVPEVYSSWRHQTPPNEIPIEIGADESLILNRYRYRPLENITHVASFALPYYAGRNNWGVFATTNWTEPLGKHLVSAFGWVSFRDTGENSYGAFNYVNNQLYPTLGFSAYRLPGNSRFYGNRFLMEKLTGGEFSLSFPLDLFEGPYRSSSVGVRLRHVLADPVNRQRFEDTPHIPQPVKGRQTDLALEWIVKKQRPWRDNHIHPLDGSGFKVKLLGADRILGSDVSFLATDLRAFTTLPLPGMHRLFLQGRYQQQFGLPFPQDFIGFSRYDNISLTLPDEVFVEFFQDTDRVRGYREFVSGKQVFFGSAEYRVPFLPSLETKILGLLSLGGTALALFTDAGIVRNAIRPDGSRDTEQRWGAGAEIKNEVGLLGLRFTHAAGIAQPAARLFSDADYDLYYRVRAVIPF